jgi:Ca-activated chloride channel family protein
MLEWFSRIPRLELAQPWWLLFVWVEWFTQRRQPLGKAPAILFPALERLRDSGFEARRWLCHLPQWLRWSALVFSVLALTGPHLLFRQSEAESRGIDVMLALDISESMLQGDFGGKSRLDAAREVARSFVLRRSNDRIGLLVFRGKGYTQCPLTLDHEVLALLLDRLSPAVIADDGTAIGSAILIAVNRLKVSESLHKVVILVTDGENNAGEIGPATAAEIAARSGIRIYVINAGFKVAEKPPDLSMKSDRYPLTDEESLRGIARTTGGGYFRIEDSAAFDQTIKAIDRLEKKRFAGPVMEHRSGLFLQLLLVAVVLLFVEVVLSNTRLLRIP